MESNNRELEKETMQHNQTKTEKGGIITMPFILANEVCEKLAMVGIGTNMLNYLTKQLNLPLTKAANTMTNFNGTASLTPLLGAFIADAFAGRFWTITFASILYFFGMIVLTVSASLKLRPPPCDANEVCQQPNSLQLAVLYMSLLLTSFGSGGIRPCVAAFGADQFGQDDTIPKKKSKTWSYFNWYYFVMGSSILIASTLVVYVQDNVGWGLGFGIPTIAMFVSIVIFVVGKPLYLVMEPAGSPYTRVVQVMVAAFRKRKVHVVSNGDGCLYQNKELDASISQHGLLHHTPQFRFLDKAAEVTEEDSLKGLETPNLWKLNTVHRVEELKSLIRMVPIMAAGILFFTSSAQQNTFSLQQANTMNRHLTKSFQIPAASMSVFTMTSMLSTIALYDRLLVPFFRKFTGLDRGLNFLHRMAIGFAIQVLATLVAGFVEVKRKHSLQPLPVFWLVPQYSIHGISEAFMAVGHLEFFYDQAAESMRSTATALFWVANSAGNYASTLLVSLVHKFSANSDGSNWLPDTDLNKGKLEYFYWLITGLQIVNFVYYLVCVKMYTFKAFQAGEQGSTVEVELQNLV